MDGWKRVCRRDEEGGMMGMDEGWMDGSEYAGGMRREE